MLKKTVIIVFVLLALMPGLAGARSFLIVINDEVDSIRLLYRYDGPSQLVTQLRRDFKARVDVSAIAVNTRPNPLNRYLNKNYDLIIGLGPKVSQTVYNAAINNDHQRFVMVDMTRGNLPQSALGFAFSYAEAGYLAGFTAAKTTQTGSVGLILGYRLSQTQDFARGFRDGVKYANPSVKYKSIYINDCFNAYLARGRAEEMFRGGADVVCHVAGLSGQGVVEAAQNTGQWAINVDGSAAGLPKNTLAAVIINYNLAVHEACLALEENRFTGGRSQLLNLANGGIDIVLGTLVPDDVKREVEQLKNDIALGRILVRNYDNRVIN